MKKAIFALTLSAVSVAFGVALAGAGSAPAAAQTNAVGDATDQLIQVQDESPEPDTGSSEREGARDKNCPDRDRDGRPESPQDGAEPSADQA